MFVFEKKEVNKLFFSFELGSSQRKNTTPCFISKNINFHFRIESLKLVNILQVHWKLDYIKIQSSACFLKIFVIRSEFLSISRFAGFNPLAMHHLKHWLSVFFMLMSAFLLARNFGSGTQELPFNGSYPTV